MKSPRIITLIFTIAFFCSFACADRIDIPAGFPDASTTGYSGTLTASSRITVTTDNTTIENLDISGGVKVQADNVTIRNCRITGGLYGVQIYSGYTGTLIEDCTIYNGTSKGVYGANFTARRCDISMYEDCMIIGSNVLIEDCYMHDLKMTEGSHNDCIQTTGASNITISGCTLQGNYQQQTSAIIFQTQYAVIDNILFEENFLSGGAYTVYLRDKNTGYGAPTNVDIIDNVFEYDSYQFGHITTSGDDIYYSGNTFHTGAYIPQNPSGNNAPSADAGSDQTVTDTDSSGAESVTLDGTGSSDSDGTITSYVWTEGGQQIATGSQPTVSLSVGVHTITLTVTDDDSDTDTDTVTITVSSSGGGTTGEIEFDAVSSSNVGASTTLSWSHTIGSGDDRALVVGVASEDGSLSDFVVSSVTYDGVAMTAVSNSVSTAGAGTRTQTQLFYMLEDDLPSAGTYTVVVTRAGTNDRQSGGAISLENVDQQAPEAVTTNTTGTSTASSISTNITTITDGAWIVDVVGQGLGGAWTATATDQIERWDINLGSAAHAGSTKEVDSAGSATMSWSFPSTHLIATSLAAFAPAEGGPSNTAPTVDAGSDQTISYGSAATLDATVTDDGLPTASVSTVWAKVSGPGTVTFADAYSVDTTATFSAAGTYVLTLVADDGDLSDSDDVTITVEQVDIELDSVSSSFVNGTTTLSWSHTIGSGSNRAVVVGVAAEDGSLSDFVVSSVTFDGVAMTAVSNSVSTAGAGTRTQTQLFYILEEDLPSAGTYTVVVTRSGTNDRQSAGAISLENVAQQAPEAVVTNTTGSTTASSMSTSITTQTDGAWIVDVIGQGQSGSWTATATDQIERWETSPGSCEHAGSTKAVESAGSTNMSWSFSTTHLIATSVAAFAPVGN